MSLLAPLGLLFLLAVAVPVIIHLLNPDKGKRLLLGSIQFLEKVKPTQQPSYRIKHWLLLLLRCLLIALLALLLARLTLPMTIGNKSYALVPQDWPANFSELQQAEFEQLLSQGAEVIVIEGNFEVVAETLAGLPQNATTSVFLANDVASLPGQVRLSDSHTTWYIAQQPAPIRSQSHWLILFSMDTQLLAQQMAEKLKVLPHLTLNTRDISSQVQTDEQYAAIINLSGEPLGQHHYASLQHAGQVFSHYQPELSKEPESVFHSDGRPVTNSEWWQGAQHVIYNTVLLAEFESWVQEPWFALSMVRLMQQYRVHGAVANQMVAGQLNSSQQLDNRTSELHWPLLMLFMLLWFLERMLAARVAQEAVVE
ncbi:BatA domain-containing protein [Planctobacterium marinum]|uniref:Aerotolerance regulator N-terminal domain-containing protein n=1 Tax=Planctobacterium marinum TaxID=1631968 RepID=A0AA48HGC6_9ALTE|nr:hypothetical protein MACH26_14220 [Planctobacterium marinum]